MVTAGSYGRLDIFAEEGGRSRFSFAVGGVFNYEVEECSSRSTKSSLCESLMGLGH